MARVTVQDCLEKCENRFALVHIGIKRTKELCKGALPQIECKNREIVTSLREIAAGKIKFKEGKEEEEDEEQEEEEESK